MANDKALVFNGITADKPINTVDIIKNLIVTHDRANMLEALSYYQNKTGSNNFLKKIIRQKINYLLRNKVKSNIDIDLTNLKEWARMASIEGVAWLHPYVDTKGEFRTRVIPGHEVIPIYDTDFNQDIVEVIRYYQIEVVTDNTRSLRTRAEVWDSEKVTYYQEDEDGNYILDISLVNPVWHFTKSYSVLNTIFKQDKVGWGAPPFIPLYNNEDSSGDFEDIKTLVKDYDKTLNSFEDAILDLNDSVLLIKDKSATDYTELKAFIDEFRMCPVDETGDAKYISPEVIEGAREKVLAILKDNIYDFGMAVDTRKLGDGGQLTNYTIAARMSDLDLKADEFSEEIYKALNILVNFYEAYKNKSKIFSFKHKGLELTFNKSTLVNVTETLKAIEGQKGIVSDETLLLNHPWVKDVKEELRRLDNEALGHIDNLPNGSR